MDKISLSPPELILSYDLNLNYCLSCVRLRALMKNHFEKYLFLIICCFSSMLSFGQTHELLVIEGEYTPEEAAQIEEAYSNAYEAVQQMYEDMEYIWHIEPGKAKRPKEERERLWNENPSFTQWLGDTKKMGKAHRMIRRIRGKFVKRMTFKVNKKNKGRCKGWIGAWTLPYGKIRVVLCDVFFRFERNRQEKIIVHEIGHEAGMLSHHRIHYCWAALRAAAEPNRRAAKKSPENYAWLAMSYLGRDCTY